jgi:hypothetical protein
MENRDRLKEALGWLKVLFVLAATAEFSLINWIVNTPGLFGLRLVAGLLAIGLGWRLYRWNREAETILLTLKGDTA